MCPLYSYAQWILKYDTDTVTHPYGSLSHCQLVRKGFKLDVHQRWIHKTHGKFR